MPKSNKAIIKFEPIATAQIALKRSLIQVPHISNDIKFQAQTQNALFIICT